MGKKTSVYLPDDLAGAVAASGATIMRAGLGAGERDAKLDRLLAALEGTAPAARDGCQGCAQRDERLARAVRLGKAQQARADAAEALLKAQDALEARLEESKIAQAALWDEITELRRNAASGQKREDWEDWPA